MSFRRFLDTVLGPGFKVLRTKDGRVPYHEDGLVSFHDHSFEQDPGFLAAYARGVEAGGADPHIRWRVHTALWVARVAARLPGDFVECGVNAGFVSSAVLEHLDWAARDKVLWLADTFEGPVFEQYTPEEHDAGLVAKVQRAVDASGYLGVERVRAHFARWPRVEIVQGVVPESLERIRAERVAYLHLDMNCALPEVAAAEHLWPRLVPGAMVLLDDYAYEGYGEQKRAMDAFAAEHGVSVLALPTGQGLMVRPPDDTTG